MHRKRETDDRTEIELGWTRLTDHDPGTRTPRGGKEEDVDGDEGDLSVNSGDVVCDGGASGVEVGLVEADGNTDDGNQELANEHTKGTPTAYRERTINGRGCV